MTRQRSPERIFVTFLICAGLLVTAACSSGGAPSLSSAPETGSKWEPVATLTSEQIAEINPATLLKTAIADYSAPNPTSEARSRLLQAIALGCLSPNSPCTVKQLSSTGDGHVIFNWPKTPKDTSRQALATSFLGRQIELSDRTDHACGQNQIRIVLDGIKDQVTSPIHATLKNIRNLSISLLGRDTNDQIPHPAHHLCLQK